ncbi:MAG: hypothetical protein ABIQ95_09485 [Bdellovibrionia bacterium]
MNDKKFNISNTYHALSLLILCSSELWAGNVPTSELSTSALLPQQFLMGGSISVAIKNETNFFLKSNGTYDLSGEMEFLEEIEALKKWAESRGEASSSDVPHFSGSPSIEYEISHLFPSHVRPVVGTTPPRPGPNCFNWALMDAKILDGQRLVSPEEWTASLQLYCKPRLVSQGERPEPGDLMAMRFSEGNNTFTEIHGAVFIGKTVSTKNGLSESQPYQISLFSSVAALYNIDQTDGCLAADLDYPKHCLSFVNYYDCNRKHRVKNGDFDKLKAFLDSTNIQKFMNSAGESGKLPARFEDLVKIIARLRLLRINDPLIKNLRDGMVQSFLGHLEYFRCESYGLLLEG